MITLEHLVKEYPTRSGSVRVLDDINLTVREGEILAIVGPSGAGKSTLAGCINLLERPTSGSVSVNGRDLSHLRERELRIARRGIGTIFQSDGLQGRRTAAENIALPLRYLGLTDRARRQRVGELLEQVGLAHRADYYPHQLSGGQRQRVGIARALALRPTVLLSDEATSGLDPETTRSIVQLIKELRAELNLSVLFITHEMETVIDVADTVARIEAGRIAEYGRLAELLVDADSQVGSALLSADSDTGELRPGPGQQLWRVSYGPQGARPDWIGVVESEIDAPIGVLEADVRVIHGTRVGHFTLQIESDRAADFAESVRRLGLRPEPLAPVAGARIGAVPRSDEARAESRLDAPELSEVGA